MSTRPDPYRAGSVYDASLRAILGARWVIVRDDRSMANCWLYLYENQRDKSIYIGIADSMSRVFGAHNRAAERLRDAPGTVILQTVEPFSSRKDARKA